MLPQLPRYRYALLACFICFSLWAAAQAGQPQAATVNQTFKVAFAAQQNGDYQLALTNYNMAITMAPDKSYLYYNRALNFKAMGLPEKAMADLQTSINLRPTAEAYSQMGNIKYEKGDLPGAKADFENARMLKQDMGKMNFCLGMIYYKNEQYEDALKCFADYTLTIKDQPDAFYYRGMSEAKLGMYPEAIASFKSALQYKDHDWKLYYKMYDFYLAVNDTANALNSISMVIEIGERKIEYYEKRAQLYQQTGVLFKYEEDMATIGELKAGTELAGK